MCVKPLMCNMFNHFPFPKIKAPPMLLPCIIDPLSRKPSKLGMCTLERALDGEWE